MSRIAVVLLAVVAFATTAPATERELTVEEFDLTRWQGKVVIVDFWASWCAPCRQAMPWLSATHARLEDQGLVTVAVAMDRDANAPNAMIAAMDDGIIVVRDPEGVLARRYRVQGLPTALLVGRDGKLQSTHVGFRPNEIPAREKELTRLLETDMIR